MDRDINQPNAGEPLREISTRELVVQVMDQARALVRDEIGLAKAELRENVRSEIKMVTGVGIGALCGLFALSFLLVAATLALAEALPGWAAALIMAGILLVVGIAAGLYGWAKRVKAPLRETRSSLKEDIEWAKRIH